MADVVDPKTRSRMMAGIRGRNTKPELLLRRELHRRGYRYRLHVGKLPGRPDLVLPRYCAVILVHGCFWHQHAGCRFAATPKSNVAFWETKLAGNVARDRRNLENFGEQGWRVATVWECGLRRHGAGAVVDELEPWLRSTATRLDIGE